MGRWRRVVVLCVDLTRCEGKGRLLPEVWPRNVNGLWYLSVLSPMHLGFLTSWGCPRTVNTWCHFHVEPFFGWLSDLQTRGGFLSCSLAHFMEDIFPRGRQTSGYCRIKILNNYSEWEREDKHCSFLTVKRCPWDLNIPGNPAQNEL